MLAQMTDEWFGSLPRLVRFFFPQITILMCIIWYKLKRGSQSNHTIFIWLDSFFPQITFLMCMLPFFCKAYYFYTPDTQLSFFFLKEHVVALSFLFRQ